jgi:hypothetical protein
MSHTPPTRSTSDIPTPTGQQDGPNLIDQVSDTSQDEQGADDSRRETGVGVKSHLARPKRRCSRMWFVSAKASAPAPSSVEVLPTVVVDPEAIDVECIASVPDGVELANGPQRLVGIMEKRQCADQLADRHHEDCRIGLSRCPLRAPTGFQNLPRIPYNPRSAGGSCCCARGDLNRARPTLLMPELASLSVK